MMLKTFGTLPFVRQVHEKDLIDAPAADQLRGNG